MNRYWFLISSKILHFVLIASIFLPPAVKEVIDLPESYSLSVCGWNNER